MHDRDHSSPGSGAADPSDAASAAAANATWVELASHPLTVLGLLHVSILAFGMPLFDHMPYWFFPMRPKHVGPWPLLAALALVPLAAWQIARVLRARGLLAVGALFLLGVFFQHGVAWSEGHGMDGMRARIVATGHAELALVAVQQPSAWQLLVDYEAKVTRGELGEYSRTRPPGELLFYMANERVARVFAPDDSGPSRLEALRDFAAVFWPLWSYLVLFPLFATLRRLIGAERALLACVCFLLVPSTALITLHSDNGLFSWLAMLTIYATVVAQAERSLAWAFAAGALSYCSTFFSFALLAVAPLAAGCAAAVVFQDAALSNTQRMRALAKTGIAALLGWAALALLFRLAFHYDCFGRLQAAMAAHAQWKMWTSGARRVFYFAWLNALEFVVWLGLPFSVLTLAAVRSALMQLASGVSTTSSASSASVQRSALLWPALSLAFVFLALDFFGRTRGEVARLWLFMVPVCCALVAVQLEQRPARSRAATIGVTFALQWLTVILTKAHQDFW